MILGMSTSTFTLVHVVLSLVGIFAGLVVLFGMFSSKRLDGWTALFLATTVLTSVTGFFFPLDKILPSHIVGIISLVVLAIAVLALYALHLAGPWRWIYVVGAVVALYLNVFVLVVQAFLKVPFLSALAPTQSDPPFIVTQLVVLGIFVVLGIVAVRLFRPQTDTPAFAKIRGCRGGRVRATLEDASRNAPSHLGNPNPSPRQDEKQRRAVFVVLHSLFDRLAP